MQNVYLLSFSLLVLLLGVGCAGLPEGAPVEFSQAQTEIEKADDDDVEEYFPQTLSRAEETLDRAVELYETAETYRDPSAEAQKRKEAVSEASKAMTLASNAREAKRRMNAWDSDISMFSQSKTVAEQLDQMESSLAGTQEALQKKIGETETNIQLRLSEQQSEASPSRLQLSSAVAYFDTGKTELSSNARAQIVDVARTLQSNPNLTAQVIGFADQRGSLELNQRLAKERAQAVMKELVANGVEQNRITTRSLGERFADAQPNRLDKLQLDRRVEVRFAPKQAE